MNPEIRQLEERVKKLESFIQAMSSSATIPFEVDGAIRTRFGIGKSTFSISAKAASSEWQPVDEAGTGTYDVAEPMVGFLQTSINGTIYQIPYYNA